MPSAINLFRSFEQMVERQPHHAAVVDCDSRQTLLYTQLLSDVERLAAELSAAGVRAGDCIGLHLPSGLNYLLTTYALWRCGACVVPIPIELAIQEKRQICDRICIHGVISNANGAGVLK